MKRCTKTVSGRHLWEKEEKMYHSSTGVAAAEVYIKWGI